MKIIDAGHQYELDCLDDNKLIGGLLTFVKRKGENFPFNHNSHPGTNCQEVLRALIDRSEYLNKQKPCAETECIIGLLKSALLLFELRAARHHERFLDLETTTTLISGKTCPTCKHIGCDNNHG